MCDFARCLENTQVFRAAESLTTSDLERINDVVESNLMFEPKYHFLATSGISEVGLFEKLYQIENQTVKYQLSFLRDYFQESTCINDDLATNPFNILRDYQEMFANYYQLFRFLTIQEGVNSRAAKRKSFSIMPINNTHFLNDNVGIRNSVIPLFRDRNNRLKRMGFVFFFQECMLEKQMLEQENGAISAQHQLLELLQNFLQDPKILETVEIEIMVGTTCVSEDVFRFYRNKNLIMRYFPLFENLESLKTWNVQLEYFLSPEQVFSSNTSAFQNISLVDDYLRLLEYLLSFDFLLVPFPEASKADVSPPDFQWTIEMQTEIMKFGVVYQVFANSINCDPSYQTSNVLFYHSTPESLDQSKKIIDKLMGQFLPSLQWMIEELSLIRMIVTSSNDNVSNCPLYYPPSSLFRLSL